MAGRLASWAVFTLATLVTPAVTRADGLMLIPAGAFWMGRDDGPADEAPLHRVFVAVFWIDRHKVTNAEFAAFLNATGLLPPGAEHRYDDDDPDARIHRRDGRFVPDPGFEDHPVVEASWFGARDYCRFKGRRLPTEAEWEKAARGDDRRRHPWGPAPPTPDTAVFGQPYNATAPVDARPGGASPYRVEDLLGNLREWTSTVFRPYPYKTNDGRENWEGVGAVSAVSAVGAAGAVGVRGAVVVRGASHDDPADELSVTRRRFYDRRGAAAGHHFVGFRCATSEDLGGY